MPRVSIITPFLNLEKYLEETIQSVLQQDTSDWELLLVDDGSTDGSTAIAQQYAERYPNQIIYLEHEGHGNKGPSVSRNYALQFARGEWIAFVDGDDLFLPARLSTQLKLADQYPHVTLFCEATLYWHSDANPGAEDKIIKVGAPDGLYKPMELTFILYPIGKGDAPCMCGLLVKKQMLVDKGGFEESFRSLYGDQVILSKIYLDQYVYITSDCNNWYRQRPGSIVQSHLDYEKYTKARTIFLKWFQSYLNKNRLGNRRLRWLIWKYLFPIEHPTAYKLVRGWPSRIKRLLKR